MLLRTRGIGLREKTESFAERERRLETEEESSRLETIIARLDSYKSPPLERTLIFTL